jgi:hypothetical protein
MAVAGVDTVVVDIADIAEVDTHMSVVGGNERFGTVGLWVVGYIMSGIRVMMWWGFVMRVRIMACRRT